MSRTIVGWHDRELDFALLLSNRFYQWNPFVSPVRVSEKFTTPVCSACGRWKACELCYSKVQVSQVIYVYDRAWSPHLPTLICPFVRYTFFTLGELMQTSRVDVVVEGGIETHGSGSTDSDAATTDPWILGLWTSTASAHTSSHTLPGQLVSARITT